MIFRTLILARNPSNGFCVNTINLGPCTCQSNSLMMMAHAPFSRERVAVWGIMSSDIEDLRFEVWSRWI